MSPIESHLLLPYRRCIMKRLPYTAVAALTLAVGLGAYHLNPVINHYHSSTELGKAVATYAFNGHHLVYKTLKTGNVLMVGEYEYSQEEVNTLIQVVDINNELFNRGFWAYVVGAKKLTNKQKALAPIIHRMKRPELLVLLNGIFLPGDPNLTNVDQSTPTTLTPSLVLRVDTPPHN